MNKKVRKVTSYFSVRKRLSEHEDDDVIDGLGKRLKTDARITDDHPDQSVPSAYDKENVDPRTATTTTTPRKRAGNKLQQNGKATAAVHSLILPDKPSDIGAFSRLPPEMVVYFFGQTEIRTLVTLSLTSHRVRELLLAYVSLGEGRRRFSKETKADIVDADKYTARDSFTNWGSLFKSLTCAYPTCKRIEIVQKFYINNRVVDNKAGWGRLFLKMTTSWDFGECAKVLNAVLQFDDGLLQRTIDLVLKEPLGSRKEDEMRVRETLRATFLDHKFADVRDFPFWISALLRTRRTVEEQARLLMLLYAPTRVVDEKTEIDWKSLCDVAVTTLSDGQKRVAPFATAINALLLTSSHNIRGYQWCEHEVFAMIEEVTTLPEPWALDNFSALMLFRPALGPIALVSRCLHTYEVEAGQIVNTMKTLAYRWRLSPALSMAQPLLATLQKLPLLDTRRIFYEAINAARQARVADLIFDNSPNTRRELQDENNSAAYFAPVLNMLLPHI
uniref:F-box domain-containing protein n=1 Tax=Plectus sambesii TaxID=2011161 RepID=A0A914X1V5_9BILA